MVMAMAHTVNKANNPKELTILPQFIIRYLQAIALITLFLGLIVLLWPAQLAGLFFNPSHQGSDFFVRMLGSTLLGYASMNAIASYKPVQRSVETAIWSNLTTLLIASIVCVRYARVFDHLAWLIIGQHLVFATGFAYCGWYLLRKRAISKNTAYL